MLDLLRRCLGFWKCWRIRTKCRGRRSIRGRGFFDSVDDLADAFVKGSKTVEDVVKVTEPPPYGIGRCRATGLNSRSLSIPRFAVFPAFGATTFVDRLFGPFRNSLLNRLSNRPCSNRSSGNALSISLGWSGFESEFPRLSVLGSLTEKGDSEGEEGV